MPTFVLYRKFLDRFFTLYAGLIQVAIAFRTSLKLRPSRRYGVAFCRFAAFPRRHFVNGDDAGNSIPRVSARVAMNSRRQNHNP